MSNFFWGISFLLKSSGLFRFSSSVRIEEGFLPSKRDPKKKYRVKYFFTKKHYENKPPTILLTHGMSGYGIDDIRMTDVAISLSSCGSSLFTGDAGSGESEIRKYLLKRCFFSNFRTRKIKHKKYWFFFH